jgi:hypothetical protein
MAKKQIEKSEVDASGEMVDYNFPAFGVTVQARDLREAEAKLQEILNTK